MLYRHLKFRVWDYKDKKWLLGYEYPNLGGFSMMGETMLFGEYSKMLGQYSLGDWERIKIMQYTGLKDRNGKEIYEGDILRKTESLPMTGHPPKQKLVGSIKKVMYCDGCYVLNTTLSSNKYRLSSAIIRYYGLQVIGNVCENEGLMQRKPLVLTDEELSHL